MRLVAEMVEGSLKLIGIQRWMGLSGVICRLGNKMCEASRCVIGRSEITTCSGTLLQCPPLAAVVVTHARLSGKVHHVVLLTRAAGTQEQSKREGRRGSVDISDRAEGTKNSHAPTHARSNPCTETLR